MDAGRPEIAIVSLPTDKFTWVYFFPGESAPTPPFEGRPKCAEAVNLFCERHALALPDGRWEIFSEIPVGQGMASSTADIVATLRCLYRIFELPYDEQVVRSILREIERADSVFLNEFALYLSRKHEVVQTLGAGLDFHACYATEPGFIKTEGVTEQLLGHYESHLAAYDQVRAEMVASFAQRDRERIAAASSRSAELAQEVLPKTHFDAVYDNRAYFGADGLLVAHTGTILGYLFTQRPPHGAMDELSSFFRGLGLQSMFSRSGL